MKIAITSTGNHLDCGVDLRFGRATGFIFYDSDTETFEYVENEQNLNAVQGAGLQSAQNVINNDVDVLITGHCGPKAFKVLKDHNITIYLSTDISVREAITKLKLKELKEALSADVESHW